MTIYNTGRGSLRSASYGPRVNRTSPRVPRETIDKGTHVYTTNPDPNTGAAGATIDPNSLQQRQMYAQQLLQDSIAAPRVPEASWTQGAARMAQALLAVKQEREIKAEQMASSQQRAQDTQMLANALMGKGDLGQAISQVRSPDIQAQLLQIAQQQRQYQQQRADKQYDTQQNQDFELKKMQAGIQMDPIKGAQTKLNQIQNNRDMLASAAAQEQDPNKKAQLVTALARTDAAVNEYKQRIMDAQGKAPNIKEQMQNEYLQGLAQNGPPGAAQLAAFNAGRIAPEDSLHKTIGEGTGKGINEQVAQIQAEAQSSASNREQADQVLQELAAHPELQSGLGTEQFTKLKTLAQTVFPGAFDGLSDQQVFQKGVGNLLLQNIGRLRTQGVQRITQQEIQNVIPMFTPTLLNSPEGIKKILELQNSLDPSLQKGSAAINAIMQKYNNDPNSVPNIQGAINDVKEATRQEAQQASINFMNAYLGKEGKKLVINPDYDPIKNPINKYMSVAADAPDLNQKLQDPSQMPPLAPQSQAENPLLGGSPQPGPSPQQMAQMQSMQMPQPMTQQPPMPSQAAAPSPQLDPRAAQAIASQAQGMMAQPSTNNVPMLQTPNQDMALQMANPAPQIQPIDPRKAALAQALMAAQQNGQ